MNGSPDNPTSAASASTDTPKPTHTPGPWVVEKHRIRGPEQEQVAQTYGQTLLKNSKTITVAEQDANARRIVACVNALEGIDPAEVATLKQQRDKLLYVADRLHKNVAKFIKHSLYNETPPYQELSAALEITGIAIADICKGGDPNNVLRLKKQRDELLEALRQAHLWLENLNTAGLDHCAPNGKHDKSLNEIIFECHPPGFSLGQLRKSIANATTPEESPESDKS